MTSNVGGSRTWYPLFAPFCNMELARFVAWSWVCQYHIAGAEVSCGAHTAATCADCITDYPNKEEMHCKGNCSWVDNQCVKTDSLGSKKKNQWVLTKKQLNLFRQELGVYTEPLIGLYFFSSFLIRISGSMIRVSSLWSAKNKPYKEMLPLV